VTSAAKGRWLQAAGNAATQRESGFGTIQECLFSLSKKVYSVRGDGLSSLSGLSGHAAARRELGTGYWVIGKKEEGLFSLSRLSGLSSRKEEKSKGEIAAQHTAARNDKEGIRAGSLQGAISR